MSAEYTQASACNVSQVALSPDSGMVHRAAGNLIDTMLGRKEKPPRIRRTDSTDSHIRSRSSSERENVGNEHRDIEDARWEAV